MKKAWVLLALVPLAASVWLAGQQRGTLPGAIRVRVTEVPVDIIVLDKDNRPVLDLKKEDFVITEDGVPQDIVHFAVESYVGGSPNEAPSKSIRPNPDSSSEPAFENPHYRTFLIVMGRGRHRYFDAIPQLTHFLRTELQATDLVAFMAYGRATDFTTDHEKLAAVLQRYEKISPSIESKLDLRMQGLAAIYGSRNVLSHYRKEIDEIFGSEDLGSRTVRTGQIPGSREQAADNRELMQAKEAVDRDEANAENDVQAPASASLYDQVLTELALDGMSFDEYMSKTAEASMDKEGLLAAIEYMRYMEGEKHLIYLNDQGLPMARLEKAQGLDALASDARVRIHTIQTGGVFLGSADSMFNASSGRFPNMRQMRNIRPFPGSTFNAFAIQSARNLARLTGGQSFNYQDVGKSLQTVERTTEASYLLGYIPKNKNLDGSFRRIEVRVNRPGVRVQHRRGYYAERELKPYDRKQFLTYSRTAAAAAYEDLIHDVDFSMTANPVPRTPQAAMHASLAIRPTPKVFTLQGNRYVGQLTISYFLFDHDGRLINETSDDLSMELKPETYDRVMKGGFPMERDLAAPDNTKDCILRVVVYDVANDQVGSAQSKLKLK